MGRSHELPRTAGRFDGDDTGCTVLHVDMDAFFASVEIKKRPELAHRPVVVGGSHRGVVAAASYEARRYGVRSAMPMTRALRLCPQAVVLPPDRAAYTAASAQVMAILRDVTPLVEPLSLDEAFLDVAAAVRRQGRPGVIAAAIRARVLAELGLTCSVGVAPVKFVAKLASARCKPDGMLVVPAARLLDFLHPLPVTALWGVGERTAESLHRLGLRTVADLAATPRDTLRHAVGNAAAEHLSALADGVDPRPVQIDEVEKSISSDRTLERDLSAAEDVRHELLRLAEDVGTRLRSRGFVARTVGIKIRFADFRTITRVRTLPVATDSTRVLHQIAFELYQALDLEDPQIRLVGVKAENLVDTATATEQLTLDLAAGEPPSRSSGAGSSGAGSSGAGSPGGRPTPTGPTRAVPGPVGSGVPAGAVPAGGAAASDVAASDVAASDVAASDVAASDVAASDAEAPDAEAPDAAEPQAASLVAARQARPRPARPRSAARAARPGQGIDRIIDAARARFGAGAVTPGSLLAAPGRGASPPPHAGGRARPPAKRQHRDLTGDTETRGSSGDP